MAFMGIQHLALTFGILGNIISFMVFLAPMPTFYRIYKKKSTEGFQSLPYLVSLFSCVLWLYYAFLKKNAFLLLTINSFGCFIQTIYIIMYIIYAPRHARYLAVKLLMMMNVASFVSIVLVIQFALHGSLRVTVLGWICVSISVSVFAAPLSIMAQVIRTKSVEFMPFNLSLFLTVSAITWFAYGAFLKDICIALPNVVGFVLGLVQMALYAVYRKSGTSGGEEEEEEEKVKNNNNKGHELGAMRNVVVVSPLELGTNKEVFPIIVIGEEEDDEQVIVKKDEQDNNKKEKNLQDIVIECPV